MSKFHPDDLINPLYEHSQVITADDLHIIYQGLVTQYKESKWWEFSHRHDVAIAGHTIYELLLWLHDGKPKLRELGEK